MDGRPRTRGGTVNTYDVTIKRRSPATSPILKAVITVSATSEDEAAEIAWDQMTLAAGDYVIAGVEA